MIIIKKYYRIIIMFLGITLLSWVFAHLLYSKVPENSLVGFPNPLLSKILLQHSKNLSQKYKSGLLYIESQKKADIRDVGYSRMYVAKENKYTEVVIKSSAWKGSALYIRVAGIVLFLLSAFIIIDLYILKYCNIKFTHVKIFYFISTIFAYVLIMMILGYQHGKNEKNEQLYGENWRKNKQTLQNDMLKLEKEHDILFKKRRGY